LSPCMAYLLLCDVIFWVLATRFYTCVFSKHLCFFSASGLLPHFLVGFALFFIPERVGLRKLFAKLDCCKTLCSFLRGYVVNCSQRSLTILLSKLTPRAAKPLTRPKEVHHRGPVQPPTVDRLASAWFRTLSVLQAKPRCPLNGLAPWVPPSPSAVGRCASVWSYCLVRASKNMNCYLPH
jgi:hypothetical protein